MTNAPKKTPSPEATAMGVKFMTAVGYVVIAVSTAAVVGLLVPLFIALWKWALVL